MICRGAPPSRRGRLIPLIKLRLGASQLVIVVKNLLANAGDMRNLGSVPELGRFPGRGHGNPLQYSCLENPMDKGALVGYSPQGRKGLDTAKGTEHACMRAQAAQSDFLPNCMELGGGVNVCVVEKPCKDHLSQVTKVKINNDVMLTVYFFDTMESQRALQLCGVPSKNSLIMRKTTCKFQQRDITQNT